MRYLWGIIREPHRCGKLWFGVRCEQKRGHRGDHFSIDIGLWGF